MCKLSFLKNKLETTENSVIQIKYSKPLEIDNFPNIFAKDQKTQTARGTSCEIDNWTNILFKDLRI